MHSSYEASAGSVPRPQRPRTGIPTQAYFAVLIIVVGVLLGREAFSGNGLAHWLLLWCALACALVSTAYLANWPGVFGKRADGTLNQWATIPVLPYQLVFWLYWQGERYLGQLAPYTEVAPGLFVGRRVLPHELPPKVDLIVDLTSEFPEPTAVRAGRQYVCMPTLDGSVPPSEDDFAALLRRISRHPGAVFVHCASGRGRAVAAVAGVLILRGVSADVGAALDHIRVLRPGIRPTPTHREMIARVTQRILREKRQSCIARTRSRDKDDDVGGSPIAIPAYSV